MAFLSILSILISHEFSTMLSGLFVTFRSTKSRLRKSFSMVYSDTVSFALLNFLDSPSFFRKICHICKYMLPNNLFNALESPLFSYLLTLQETMRKIYEVFILSFCILLSEMNDLDIL